MRRFHLQNAVPLSLVVLAAAMTGCASLPGTEPSAQATSAPAPESFRLFYRTKSDRLNLASGAAGSVQPASFQQPAGGLPSVTTSTLQLRYPHPAGMPDLAEATLVVMPGTSESESSWSLSSLLPASLRPDSGGTQSGREPVEVWTADVPKWQLDAIVAKLKAEGFFRRATVLGPEVYVGTEQNGVKFGKDYRKIEELDALVLRTRGQGRLVGGIAYRGAMQNYMPPSPATAMPAVQMAAVPGVQNVPFGPPAVPANEPFGYPTLPSGPAGAPVGYPSTTPGAAPWYPTTPGEASASAGDGRF
ncbi:MAG: hypothetical protein HYS13_21330 [Planctomycetia bacterium]|nr:hypothetical protein [Planctomycetia bacterium]